MFDGELPKWETVIVIITIYLSKYHIILFDRYAKNHSQNARAVRLQLVARLTLLADNSLKDLTVEDRAVEVATTIIEPVPVITTQTVTICLLVCPAELID